MPFCPLCSAPVTLNAARCSACGVEYSSASGLRPLESLEQQATVIGAYSGLQPFDSPPLISGALKFLLRLCATCITVVCVVLASFFATENQSLSLWLGAAILLPIAALWYRGVPVLLGAAALAVLAFAVSCSANFRWGGG